MRYTEYRPAASLRRYIACFWWIDSGCGNVGGPVWDRTLPDGSLEVVLHLADPMLRKGLAGCPERESRAILIGQTTRPYLFAATGEVRMLGVRLFPHTAHLFFGGDIAEFNDQSVDLEAILPPADRLPVAAIENAADPEAAVRLLEGYFLCRQQKLTPGRQDRYVGHACRAITASGGNLSISAASRELEISNRYLQRLFLARVGISPKLFARIIRFQGIFKALTATAPVSLAEVAQEAGYFDQSHFTREFRAFAGLAPGEFLRERHPMSQHFIEPANRSYLYNFD